MNRNKSLTTTVGHVLDAAQTSSTARDLLKKLHPEAFEPELVKPVMGDKGVMLPTAACYLPTALSIRNDGKYTGRSIYLGPASHGSDTLVFSVVVDDQNCQVLICTKQP